MGAIPYWGDRDEGEDEDARSWDFCWLGDDLLPGVATVEVTDNGRDVDVQKPKGSNGVSLKDNGVGAAKVKITLQIYTGTQYDAWLKLRKRIDPKNAGGIREPKTISHPETDEAGVKGVYVKQIQAAPPTAKSGRTYTIDCVEWFPQPVKAKSTQKIKPPGNASGRQGLPGETIPLTAVEGLDGLDLGPEPPAAL
jgi:hypothetical protein